MITTKLLIKMSPDYFNIVAPDIEEYEPYPIELQEFWEFAEDVMWIPSDVYSILNSMEQKLVVQNYRFQQFWFLFLLALLPFLFNHFFNV